MAAILQLVNPKAFSWYFHENARIIIAIKISLNFVPWGPIDNSSALVQIMVWRQLDYKPLSEPVVVSLQTYICVTPPQWVNRMSAFVPIANQEIDSKRQKHGITSKNVPTILRHLWSSQEKYCRHDYHIRPFRILRTGSFCSHPVVLTSLLSKIQLPEWWWWLSGYLPELQ